MADHVTTGCHIGHMIRSHFYWLLIISEDKDLSFTAWSLRWEHTMSMHSGQKDLLSVDANVQYVGVEAQPFIAAYICVM